MESCQNRLGQNCGWMDAGRLISPKKSTLARVKALNIQQLDGPAALSTFQLEKS